MARKKLVNIGQQPEMPTIREFLVEMAERQGDEIRRLKAEALGEKPSLAKRSLPDDQDRISPDPWALHPVRETRPDTKKPTRTSRKKPGSGAASKSS